MNEIIETSSEPLDKQFSTLNFQSGGSTPRPVFEALSSLCADTTNEFCINRSILKQEQTFDQNDSELESIKIDWSRVALFLIDERYVPLNDALSNQKMIRDSLLSNCKKF